MSLPYRVSLPHPLPENVVPFPGALDRLVLHFGDLPVRVSSEATQASSPFDVAVGERSLSLTDNSGEGIDLPVTGVEAAGLAPFADLAKAWTKAREARDLHGLMTVVAAVRKLTVPWWLDIRFDMPGRHGTALTA